MQRPSRAWLPALFAALTISAIATPAATAETAGTTLEIRGMTCGGCVASVKLQLRKTEGVTAYEVSLEKGEADVRYDPARTDPEKIRESVAKTGFEVSVKAKRDPERQPEGGPRR